MDLALMACDHLYCKWHRSGDKSALKLLTLSSITYSTGTGAYKDMLSVNSLVSIYIKYMVTCANSNMCVWGQAYAHMHMCEKKRHSGITRVCSLRMNKKLAQSILSFECVNG